MLLVARTVSARGIDNIPEELPAPVKRQINNMSNSWVRKIRTPIVPCRETFLWYCLEDGAEGICMAWMQNLRGKGLVTNPHVPMLTFSLTSVSSSDFKTDSPHPSSCASVDSLPDQLRQTWLFTSQGFPLPVSPMGMSYFPTTEESDCLLKSSSWGKWLMSKWYTEFGPIDSIIHQVFISIISMEQELAHFSCKGSLSQLFNSATTVGQQPQTKCIQGTVAVFQ